MSNFGHLPDLSHMANNGDMLRPVLSQAHDRIGCFTMPMHQHSRAELIYAADGLMQVSTPRATWVLPPQQALWIPAGVEHAMSHSTTIALRILYLHPAMAVNLPQHCQVISVSPLLREMIMHVTSLEQNYSPEGTSARLMATVPDLIADAHAEPLQLPMPTDRRLVTITDGLIQQPADKSSLSHWANKVGASERTLSRKFREETGMSFNEWRQRLRLLTAITFLSDGRPVTEVALELGYESPSAFIAMFRRELGSSPKRYLKQISN